MGAAFVARGDEVMFCIIEIAFRSSYFNKVLLPEFQKNSKIIAYYSQIHENKETL
ncbi:hypothetical protein SAMN02910456_00427 [Ruminococcaceae bacterium YRB3002]|nr:hypothetical protein SAMN02910456_00427 [Ruminococcaceae bacterium YRB3002]